VRVGVRTAAMTVQWESGQRKHRTSGKSICEQYGSKWYSC